MNHFGSSAMLKFDRVSSRLLTLSMAKVQLSSATGESAVAEVQAAGAHGGQGAALGGAGHPGDFLVLDLLKIQSGLVILGREGGAGHFTDRNPCCCWP